MKSTLLYVLNGLFAGLARLRTLFPSSHYALLATFFFVGLELTFNLRLWGALLLLLVLLILTVGIILIRSEEGGDFHITQTILPIFSAIGFTGFALFLPNANYLHAYFLLASFLMYFVLRYGSKKAFPNWNWTVSFFVLFTLLATILGWRFHLFIPVMLVLSLVFVSFTLMSLQSLARIVPHSSESWLLALVIGFVLTQVAWALLFMPLHFLVSAGVLVALYYVIFHLLSLSYEKKLTKQDIVEYIVLGAISLFVLLFTARWI